VKEAGLAIELRPGALLQREPLASAGFTEALWIHVPTALQRCASEIKLMVPGRDTGPSADPALIKAIARGHAWFAELASGQAATIAAIAAREKVTDRYVSSLLKLAFLPPNLVTACLAGEATALSTMAAVTSEGPPLL
jgi:hypothetical protein